jgi:hypothetical protein
MLAGVVIEFALLDSTKRLVYWVAAVPLLCIALADLGLALWQEVQSARAAIAARAVVILVAAVFVLEGAAVGLNNVKTAIDATSLADVGEKVAAAVPAGSVVMGDNRLGMTLGAARVDERSVHLLFYYTNPHISRGRVTDIGGAFARSGAQYLLLSPLTREMLKELSPQDTADFAAYIRERASLADTVAAGSYGPIEVYQLK